MSHTAIEIAISDRILTGSFRLAFIAIGDCGGRISIPLIMRWCNCNEETAFGYVISLFNFGYLELGEDDKMYSAEMLDDMGMYSSVKSKDKRPSIPKGIRLAVYARDKQECHYCSSSFNLTLDHVVPRCRGGGDHSDNLVTCCKSCNSSKGSKSYDDFLEWRKANGKVQYNG